jgi:hypothetical protein
MAKLDLQAGIRMLEEGHTHAEIADQLGGTVSGWRQAFRRAGYTKKNTSHKDWLPWTVAEEHHNAYVAKLIRHLSHLEKGHKLSELEEEHRWLAKTAIDWANKLLDQGLDYDYDRDVPPNEFSNVGGFFAKPPESKNRWMLRKLMQRVITTQSSRLK